MEQEIMNEHEDKIIEAFIVKTKRERYKSLIANPKKRGKFVQSLNHFQDLDERYVTWLPSNAPVEELLRGTGSPAEVYIVSATETIDGEILSLKEAIHRTMAGGWGTIISCIAGELAYYYDEVGERRALLQRK